MNGNERQGLFPDSLERQNSKLSEAAAMIKQEIKMQYFHEHRVSCKRCGLGFPVDRLSEKPEFLTELGEGSRSGGEAHRPDKCQKDYGENASGKEHLIEAIIQIIAPVINTESWMARPERRVRK